MSFIIQEQASPVLFEIGKEEPTGAGGTIDFYLADQDFLYYEGMASANFSIDLVYDAATTLDDALNVDDLVTVTLAVTNGSTPYYLTNFQIDNGAGAVTINWEGGLAPVIGNQNSIDYYTFKVLKTSGNAYTVFAALVSNPIAGRTAQKEVIINSGISGTSTIYLGTEDIVFYNATSTSQFQINASFLSGVTLNDVMATGDVKNCSIKTVCATGADLTNIAIDSGSSTATFFFDEKFPSATPGFLNEFNLEIVKTGSATFNVDVDKTLLTYPGTSSFAPATVELLVVAGGGGTAAPGLGSGGGGAGGYRTDAAFSISQSSYTVTVGGGGAGITVQTLNTNGGNGTDSSFGTFTSTGGGGGGGTLPTPTGGSGGGGRGQPFVGGAGNTPPTVPSQGNNGGNGAAGPYFGGGGGGGASAVGATGYGTGTGNGGAGTASTITGSSITYAGGGGGGSLGVSAGAGGVGGGGQGAISGGAVRQATAGTPNTGGGGGGGVNSTYAGKNGGSGIVIMAFPTTSGKPPTVGAGLTYTIDTASRAGYTVISFTQGSDTISWG